MKLRQLALEGRHEEPVSIGCRALAATTMATLDFGSRSNGMTHASIDLRELAKHNRELADQAEDAEVAERLLEIAEDLEDQAARQERAQGK